MVTRPAESSPSGFRADVEGLRGLAILLVVVYHGGLLRLHGGFIGVDVFFVLSGYLITGILAREAASAGRVDFVEFYARRMRRLLPAAGVVLLATLLAAWFVYSPLEQYDVTRSTRWAALYLANVRFAAQALDYHAAESALNPLLHTWSLAVEEQFYLVWPLFFAAAVGVLRPWGPQRAFPSQVALRRGVIAVGVASAVSFALALWQTSASQPWAFFGLPARAWEFGVGALVAVRIRRFTLLPARFTPWLAWAGLGMVLGGGFLYTASTPFPGVAALAPVVGTLALLVAGEAEAASLVRRGLCSPPMQAFGRLSYSWYLWHWPVLVLASAVLGPLTVWQRLACLVLALALAAVTHFVVEAPVRRHGWLKGRPALSICGGLALTLVVALVSEGQFTAASAVTRRSPQREFWLAREDRVETLDARGCQLDSRRVRELQPCVFGDTASAKVVVLFGDSHAGQWFPAAERAALANGWRLVTLVKSACPVIVAPIYHAKLNRAFTECAEWRDSSIARVTKMRPDLVIVAQSAAYVRGQTGGAAVEGIGSPEVPAPTPEGWQRGLRATLRVFDAARILTVVLRDTPRPGFDVPGCLARATWAPWQERVCLFDRATGMRSDVAAAEAAAAFGLPHVRVVDLTEHICRTSPCEPVRNGMVLFRDTNHLTARYSATLAPMLEAALVERLPQTRLVVSEAPPGEP
jgi:peptidoglycan/LPS O-acetylase OafA/YrhL